MIAFELLNYDGLGGKGNAATRSNLARERLRMTFINRAALSLFTLAMLPTANSQSVSGSIRGTVADGSGSIVAGATVRLTNQLTRQVREFLTDDTGTFLFPNLVPGNYDLGIAQPGFKTFVQNGINVTAQERVDVHTLKLEVG